MHRPVHDGVPKETEVKTKKETPFKLSLEWRIVRYKLQNLFVHNHQALRVPVASPDEVDAFLVLGSRDDQLRLVGVESLDLLAQCVVKAYHAKVLALEGYAFVGGIGEHGQCRAVFIDADGHLVNDVDLEVARRGVDIHLSFEVFLYRHIDIDINNDGFSCRDGHAFGDVLAIIHAMQRKDGVGSEGIDGYVFSGHVGNGQLARLIGLTIVVDVQGLRVDGQRARAVVGLQAVLLHGIDHILCREGIEVKQASDGDAAVGHDEDESRAGHDAVKVEDLIAATIFSYGRKLNAVFIGPLLADGIAIDVRNFNVEHIMHVASHLGIGSCDVGRNHLTLTAGIEEEIDEYGLTAIKDFEEVVSLAVTVGDGEVNGFGEGGLLCAKACAKEQEREKNVKLFHGS